MPTATNYQVVGELLTDADLHAFLAGMYTTWRGIHAGFWPAADPDSAPIVLAFTDDPNSARIAADGLIEYALSGLEYGNDARWFQPFDPHITVEQRQVVFCYGTDPLLPDWRDASPGEAAHTVTLFRDPSGGFRLGDLVPETQVPEYLMYLRGGIDGVPRVEWSEDDDRIVVFTDDQAAALAAAEWLCQRDHDCGLREYWGREPTLVHRQVVLRYAVCENWRLTFRCRDAGPGDPYRISMYDVQAAADA